MLETLWTMTKFLIYATLAGIPLVIVAVLVKPKINLSQDAKEILKCIAGILLIIGLVWLSTKG
jgi:uncharacterized membrane protein YedE/YeeE